MTAFTHQESSGSIENHDPRSYFLRCRPASGGAASTPASTGGAGGGAGVVTAIVTLRHASTGLHTLLPHNQNRTCTLIAKSPVASARTGTAKRGASASGSTASLRPSRRFLTLTPPPSGARSIIMPASFEIVRPRSIVIVIGS